MHDTRSASRRIVGAFIYVSGFYIPRIYKIDVAAAHRRTAEWGRRLRRAFADGALIVVAMRRRRSSDSRRGEFKVKAASGRRAYVRSIDADGGVYCAM